MDIYAIKTKVRTSLKSNFYFQWFPQTIGVELTTFPLARKTD